ncbi:MAG: TraM recognition domain-containing protein [Nitrospirae bacterium]|nr:TraM recognition domain-containing protein [Nitrospirota bacterium]
MDIGQIAKQKQVLLADTSMMTFDNRVYITSLIAHYVRSYVEFERRKHPLIVFIDEFQTAISPVFSHLLALARGYKVGFVLAHQEFGQIDKSVLKSVLGNANTIVCFAIGYDEADRMRHEYGGGVKADDFIKLDDYVSLIKIKNKVHRVMTFPPPDMPEPEIEELPPENRVWNFLREGWFSC